MKLLFDENLSPKLPRLLPDIFLAAHTCVIAVCAAFQMPMSGSMHAPMPTLSSRRTPIFQQRSVLYGSPPKLIWLRIGNCTRQQIVDLVTAHQHDILALETNPLETVLVLS